MSRQGSSSQSLFTSRTCRRFPRLAGSDPTSSSDAIGQALSHYSHLRLHTKTLISRERASERGRAPSWSAAASSRAPSARSIAGGSQARYWARSRANGRTALRAFQSSRTATASTSTASSCGGYSIEGPRPKARVRSAISRASPGFPFLSARSAIQASTRPGCLLLGTIRDSASRASSRFPSLSTSTAAPQAAQKGVLREVGATAGARRANRARV